MGVEEGQRLERYIKSRVSQDEGGLKALSARAGISTDSLHKSFRGASEPSLRTLGRVAEQLGVRRWELVAVYDGDIPSLDLGRMLDQDPELRGQFVNMLAQAVQRQVSEHD